MENKIIGQLDPFFETGTEGVIWCIYDDSKTGYDGLNPLHDGDHLFIYNKDKTLVLWSGKIDFDWKTRLRPYPMNPQYSQQEVLGYWVHGLQKDLDPDQWG